MNASPLPTRYWWPRFAALIAAAAVVAGSCSASGDDEPAPETLIRPSPASTGPTDTQASSAITEVEAPPVSTTAAPTATTEPGPARETISLPDRPGEPPRVTDGVPHLQINQGSPRDVYDELVAFAFSLEGVVRGPSVTGLTNTPALHLSPDLAANPDAMIGEREFAHIHGLPRGGSLHLRLSLADAAQLVRSGYGEYHPLHLNGAMPGFVMVYAPRDAADLEVVKVVIEASLAYATAAG